ncbi:CPBP family intramembrane glutamic endopeptidase [Roseivirga sp. BDSF3-8]|uniref:CPBP family intramembrane glutamic endopeptidase n=1 Tax=Roseivirga sp. BDSF3-8 TaxID=3241598 RepID=UPI0035327B88
MTRTSVRLLALLTILVFGGGGLAIICFFDPRPLFQVFFNPSVEGVPSLSILMQGLGGGLYGFVSAFILWRIVCMDFLKPTRHFFSRLIGSLDLTTFDIVFISVCAGAGEELFFRGALQPWIGIWLTSLIFVAIHGYLSPRNKPLSVYGACMVFVIAGIGYMMRFSGLFSAIVAHTVIDIYLFYKLSKDTRPRPDENE